VSDVHLSPRDPAGIERFVAFLRDAGASVATLLVAGDLFEVWTSPAQARDPALAPVFAGLRGLVARGVDVGFVEGNRDFAATPALRAAGATVHPDVVTFADGGLRVTVTHGDLLCRRDVRYQAFRRVARTPLVRNLLRKVPESWADATGRAARTGSAMETSRKAEGDMGLDPVAVAAMLRATDADALVCGHVHWGRRHAIDVDGAVRDVVVLGAWDSGDATFARIADGRVDFVRVP
jgi:UDP-2,3-diacylglucosamine hydrolase